MSTLAKPPSRCLGRRPRAGHRVRADRGNRLTFRRDRCRTYGLTARRRVTINDIARTIAPNAAPRREILALRSMAAV